MYIQFFAIVFILLTFLHVTITDPFVFYCNFYVIDGHRKGDMVFQFYLKLAPKPMLFFVEDQKAYSQLDAASSSFTIYMMCLEWYAVFFLPHIFWFCLTILSSSICLLFHLHVIENLKQKLKFLMAFFHNSFFSWWFSLEWQVVYDSSCQ